MGLASKYIMAAISVLQCCHAARILAVFPDTARSHVIAYEPLTKALAARGHHVTVISAFPQKEPIANYRDIAVPFSWFGLDRNVKDMSDLYNRRFDPEAQAMSGMVPYQTCRYYLRNPDVQALIHSKHEEFDLLILEVLVYECFLGFAHRFNTPIIGIYAQAGSHNMLNIVGSPSSYAYAPNTVYFASDHLTFAERLLNMVSIDTKIRGDYIGLTPFNNFCIQKYFNTSLRYPTVSEIKQRFALLLFNTDESFSATRPYLPTVVNIAGMHIYPPQSLPQDMQEFLDGASSGAVCVSMGSHTGMLRFPEPLRNVLLEAFSTLPYRVLWKEDENVEDVPANVMLKSWIPQGDVLAHPNVRVFVSHGGLLGTQEAIYHGVPIVGIPICKDQQTNIELAENLGLARLLEFDNITIESVQWILGIMMQDSSYRENARRVSARFRDQPIPPLQKAVYWTEYVLRHKGAPHLRSAALDLNWCQYFMLDVAAIPLILVGVVWAVVKMAAIMITRLHNKRRKFDIEQQKQHQK